MLNEPIRNDVVVTLDEIERVLIPAEIRELLDLKPATQMSIDKDTGVITLKKPKED